MPTDIKMTVLNIPAEVWVLLLGGSVTVITQFIKKAMALEKDKHVMTIVIVLAALFTAIEAFVTNANLPPTILGLNTLAILGVATPLYIYVVKPLTAVAVGYKLYKTHIAAKIEEIEEVTARDVAQVAPTTPVVPVTDNVAVIEDIAEEVEQKTNKTPVVADF